MAYAAGQSMNGQAQPTFGFTRAHEWPVHAHTFSHLANHTTYNRFNKAVAVRITKNVGTMTCFWVFCLLAILGLPAALVEAGVLPPSIGVIGSLGFIVVVQWVAGSFLQLVLLPSLMVGQNLQNAAADARAAKTLEHAEDIYEHVVTIIDLLDMHTQKGLGDVHGYLEALRADLEAAGTCRRPLAPPAPPG
jgi:hypothetical protein